MSDILQTIFKNYKKYIITSKYGARTINGVSGFHYGVDLVAKNNDGYAVTDYIQTISDGVVSEVGYNSTSGYYVKYKKDNVEYFNCHLVSASALKIGQAVKKGTIVGYMGNTGNSTGAHLHLGIKVNGVYVNPLEFLKIETVDEISVKTLKLKKGDKNACVKSLQSLLNLNGAELDLDGSFGSKTESAVKKYQKSNKLEVDGVVGVSTWTSLLRG